MHCNCCDKMLSDTEIIWNKDLGQWEPCSKCLEIALDAAYSGGFVRGDEEIIEEFIDNGEIETLDIESWDEGSADQFSFRWGNDRADES